jgi:hypothetical protein
VNREFLLSTLKLAVQGRDYGIDLDGDGTVDNRFGAVISALLAQGLYMQGRVDQAVSDATVLVLLRSSRSDQSSRLTSEPNSESCAPSAPGRQTR